MFSFDSRPVLKEALQQACKKHNLQATSWFVTKMIELYEMIKVQHGIMIIGRPMSCKSKLYSILSEALTKLAEENKFDKFTTYHKAMFKVINPKSMTLHQLYGWVSSTPFLHYFQFFFTTSQSCKFAFSSIKTRSRSQSVKLLDDKMLMQ